MDDTLKAELAALRNFVVAFAASFPPNVRIDAINRMRNLPRPKDSEVPYAQAVAWIERELR